VDTPAPLPEPPIQHPPVMPRPLASPPTAWPTVLGVIAIVFGAGGLLMSAWGAIAPLVIKSWPSFGSGFDPMAGVAQWQAWLIAQNIVAVFIAALLLTGGIMLLRRTRASRAVLRTWAALKIILVVAASMIGYQVGQTQLAAMQQAGATAPGMQNFIALFNWIGVAIGVLWGWALPVFMLIWLARRPIRTEMAAW
jgi:hypothetical protein